MKNVKQAIKRLIYLLRTKEKIPILVPASESSLLRGKVALISGGSGGIGKAIAEEMINCGCSVIVAGTQHSKLDRIIEELGASNAKEMILDITDVNSFESKVAEAANLFPQKRIDILINCAGVNDPTQFLEVSEQIYDRVMNVNAKGTFFLSQTVARHMIERNTNGHILNISSSSALRPASTPYTISKWAVAGMTKGMADVLIKYHIIVNALAPGPVATEMVGKSNAEDIEHPLSPSGRYALPCEVAHYAVQLVSGYGDLIVGETLYMTGGSGTISLHR